MIDKGFYTGGPFGECRHHLENFGMGIYYLTCLQHTVEELLKLQEEYEDALRTRDTDQIDAKKTELEFYENIIMLATDMLETPPSHPSSSYD